MRALAFAARAAALAAALAATLAGGAQAQTVDNPATVDALASFVAGQNPIQIQGAPMQFGDVAVPARSSEQAFCRYRVETTSVPAESNTVTAVSQVGSRSFAASETDSGDPTPLGCTRSGPASAALFGFLCEAEREVNYSVAFEDNAADDADFQIRPGMFVFDTTGFTTNFRSIASTESAGSLTCDSAGLVFSVGGEMIVGPDQATGEQLQVGSVTFEASY